MSKAKVSIIVPIYNVEKYLKRCVDSLVNQTLKDIEIILVDDKSPDKCPYICDEYVKNDSRIKVIHKERNEGLGKARNSGLEIATGEYICFVDGDDFIDINLASTIYNYIIEEKTEIVLYGYNFMNSENEIKEYIPKSNYKKFLGNDVQNIFLPDLIYNNNSKVNSSNFLMTAWAAMFSSKLIKDNDWRFVSERNIIAEDVYSLLILYSTVKSVSIYSKAFYYYCENENSLTHEYREDRYAKIKYFYKECISLAERLNYSKEIKKRLAFPYLSFSISALKMIIMSKANNKYKKFKEIVLDDIFIKVLKTSDLKYEKKVKRVLFWCIKHKLVILSYFICYMRVKLNG